jgi:hypothetical protein
VEPEFLEQAETRLDGCDVRIQAAKAKANYFQLLHRNTTSSFKQLNIQKMPKKEPQQQTKLDSYAVHEALDRASIIDRQIYEFLINHAVYQQKPELRKHIDKAVEALGKFYQEAGNLPEYE